MTILARVVTRQAVQKIQGDSAIVTLHPAGWVEIRRKGRRESYRMSFEEIFMEGARRLAAFNNRRLAEHNWRTVRLRR